MDGLVFSWDVYGCYDILLFYYSYGTNHLFRPLLLSHLHVHYHIITNFVLESSFVIGSTSFPNAH